MCRLVRDYPKGACTGQLDEWHEVHACSMFACGLGLCVGLWNVKKSKLPSLDRLLEGGAESGFRHVEAKTYTPRLMHFSGTGKNVVAKQV